MAHKLGRVGIVLLWALVAIFALLASLLTHLDSEAGRATVCAEVMRAVDGAIIGTFSTRCAELEPTRVRLEDVRIGLDDRELIRVGSVETEPALFDLMAGDIRVDLLRVQDAQLDLRDFDVLGQAFASPVPSEDGSPIELPDVVVRKVELKSIRAALPELLDASLDLDANVRLGPTMRIGIESLRADVTRDEHALANLQLSGAVDTGETSQLDARIVTGASHLELNTQAEWGETLETGPTSVQLTRLVAHVDPESLQSPGLEPWTGAVALRVPLDVQLDGGGWLDDARVQGSIESDAGTVQVSASWVAGTAHLDVDTTELRLAGLLSDLPESIVAGHLEASLDSEDMRLEVHGQRLRYDTYGAPEVRAEATILPDAIQLASVSLPHVEQGGHLDVHGRIGFDGTVDLEVDADLPQVARDPNVNRLVPGLRAGVRTRARVRVGDTLDIDGRVSLREVAYAGVNVGALSATGTVSGPPAAPALRFDVQGERIRQGQGTFAVGVQRIGLALRSDGHSYTLRGDGTDAGGRPLSLDVNATLGAQTQVAGVVRTALILDEPYEVNVRRLVVAGSNLDVDATLHATSGLHVEASGRLGRNSDLQATLRDVPLALLDERFELGLALQGTADARASLQGSLRAPRGTLRLDVQGLSARGAPPTNVVLNTRLEQVERRARAVTNLRVSGDHGGARLAGNVMFPTANPQRDIRSATLGLVLNADAIDVATWAAPFTETPIEGLLQAEVQIQGTPQAPALNGTASLEALKLENGDPIDVGLTSRMSAGVGHVELTLHDAHGVLGRVHARSDGLGSATTLEELLDSPFALRVETPERRLDSLPRPFRVEQPLTVGANVALETGMEGQLSLMASHASTEACTDGLPGVVRVDGTLHDAMLDVSMRGTLGDREPLHANTRVEAPLRRWLLQGFPESIPAIHLRARAENLELATAPVVCEHASGALSFNADIVDLFGTRPHVAAAGQIDALSIAGTEPLQVTLDADADVDSARANVIALTDGRRAMRAHANVPLVWTNGLPALADEEWSGRVKLRTMPVTPLLILAPNIRQPRGAITGDIRIRAQGEDIGVNGGLELQDVSAILERPLIRFDALNGAIQISEEEIRLDNVRYRDREGRVRLDGRIGMDGLVPQDADVRARFDEMPFRVEGVVFAILDADARVQAQLSEEGNQVELSLREVDVKLPEDAGRVVQGLEQHDEVVFVDDVGFDAAMTQVAEQEQEREATPREPVAEVPTRVRVDSTPFWVRRDDFSIQLDAQMRVAIDPHVRLMGRVQVRRGFIELLGKNFEFQRGEIRFTGGRDVDPVLDLQADHELKTGETVTVRITGNLSRPQLAFTTTVPGVQSEREVIQLLVSGRSSPAEVQTAQEQASSALAGLMAGFLSTLTRRELGAYVPVFRVEAEGTNTARVRAGFSADDIIPEFMRGVVVGAYVEGFVGTDQDDGGAQRTTGGVLIELLHPRHIVTRSTWEEPNNWSLDFIWEPL